MDYSTTTQDSLLGVGQTLPGEVGYSRGPNARFQKCVLHFILLAQASPGAIKIYSVSVGESILDIVSRSANLDTMSNTVQLDIVSRFQVVLDIVSRSMRQACPNKKQLRQIWPILVKFHRSLWRSALSSQLTSHPNRAKVDRLLEPRAWDRSDPKPARSGDLCGP